MTLDRSLDIEQSFNLNLTTIENMVTPLACIGNKNINLETTPRTMKTNNLSPMQKKANKQSNIYKTPVTPDHGSNSFSLAKRNKFMFGSKQQASKRQNEQTRSQQHEDDKISQDVKSQMTCRTRICPSQSRYSSKPSPDLKYPPQKVIYRSTKKLTTFKSFHLTPNGGSGRARSRGYVSPLKLKQIEKSLGLDKQEQETQLREKDQNLLKDEKAMDVYVQGLMNKYF